MGGMIPIGISTIPTERSTDIATLARRAEELDFESIWVPEQHTLPVVMEKPVPRLWGDIVDPLIALARALAATTTLKLGTAIIVVPARNPNTLAKEVATLDMYSGGRLLFGIGVGGLQEEAQILGVDFDHRWTQGKEAIMELWTRERSEYHGSYYDFPPVYCFPKPGRRPYPPIILGSKALNAFKRIAAVELEPSEYVEHDQRDKSLSIGRALENLVAAITGPNRSDVFAASGGKVVECVQPAVALESCHHVPGNRPGIEPVGSVSGDLTQGLGEFRQGHAITNLRGATTWQVHTARSLGTRHEIGEPRPVVGNTGWHRIASLGELDGGYQ